MGTEDGTDLETEGTETEDENGDYFLADDGTILDGTYDFFSQPDGRVDVYRESYWIVCLDPLDGISANETGTITFTGGVLDSVLVADEVDDGDDDDDDEYDASVAESSEVAEAEMGEKTAEPVDEQAEPSTAGYERTEQDRTEEGRVFDEQGQPLEGVWGFATNDATLSIFPEGIVDALLRQSIGPADMWAHDTVEENRLALVWISQAIGFPPDYTNAAGRVRFENGYVTAAERSFLQATSDEAVDWMAVQQANHDVVARMCARGASEADRRASFMMDGEKVLLGDGHPWAAVKALGQAPGAGILVFHRNRMSANEFHAIDRSGVVSIPHLQAEIDSHISDTGIYTYGDAERVKVKMR